MEKRIPNSTIKLHNRSNLLKERNRILTSSPEEASKHSPTLASFPFTASMESTNILQLKYENFGHYSSQNYIPCNSAQEGKIEENKNRGCVQDIYIEEKNGFLLLI